MSDSIRNRSIIKIQHKDTVFKCTGSFIDVSFKSLIILHLSLIWLPSFSRNPFSFFALGLWVTSGEALLQPRGGCDLAGEKRRHRWRTSWPSRRRTCYSTELCLKVRAEVGIPRWNVRHQGEGKVLPVHSSQNTMAELKTSLDLQAPPGPSSCSGDCQPKRPDRTLRSSTRLSRFWTFQRGCILFLWRICSLNLRIVYTMVNKKMILEQEIEEIIKRTDAVLERI